ncbi:MAG: class II aldolase [Gammaproteobacteria bacterium]|nr:class II aldolase [Gammaproteobacteria bacterium]
MRGSCIMDHTSLREAVIAAARSLNKHRLGVGTAGNVSARVEQGYLITPTGMDYEAMVPTDIVTMDMHGNRAEGDLKPSSEWRFHQDIYAARREIHAIVHTHSPCATALSCTRQDLPAFHYMVAGAGGSSIRCAAYATYGTQELSDNTLAALADRQACLLANHGVIALGEDVESAFKMAQLVEELARQYLFSRMAGTPVLLGEDEMNVNLEKFKDYGKQD